MNPAASVIDTSHVNILDKFRMEERLVNVTSCKNVKEFFSKQWPQQYEDWCKAKWNVEVKELNEKICYTVDHENKKILISEQRSWAISRLDLNSDNQESCEVKVDLAAVFKMALKPLTMPNAPSPGVYEKYGFHLLHPMDTLRTIARMNLYCLYDQWRDRWRDFVPPLAALSMPYLMLGAGLLPTISQRIACIASACLLGGGAVYEARKLEKLHNQILRKRSLDGLYFAAEALGKDKVLRYLRSAPSPDKAHIKAIELAFKTPAAIEKPKPS